MFIGLVVSFYSKREVVKSGYNWWSKICKQMEFHTMEYHSAIKRNEVLMHVPACLNLVNVCEVKEAKHKRSHLCDHFYMIYPKWANP